MPALPEPTKSFLRSTRKSHHPGAAKPTGSTTEAEASRKRSHALHDDVGFDGDLRAGGAAELPTHKRTRRVLPFHPPTPSTSHQTSATKPPPHKPTRAALPIHHPHKTSSSTPHPPPTTSGHLRAEDGLAMTGRTLTPRDLLFGWPLDFRTPDEAEKQPHLGVAGCSKDEARLDWTLMQLEPGHHVVETMTSLVTGGYVAQGDPVFFRRVEKELRAALTEEELSKLPPWE